MVTKTLKCKVTSSNIQEVSFVYNPNTKDKLGSLTVEFKSGLTYVYSQVPLEVVEQVISAESVGKAFNELIKKGGYKFQRIH